jgi:hypothetical protein
VLVRDYGKGDWAEQRFSDARRLRKLGDNYYVRGDGTRAFYFSKAGSITWSSVNHRCLGALGILWMILANGWVTRGRVKLAGVGHSSCSHGNVCCTAR